MGQPIKSITIEGFKSIRRLDAFPLGPLNVLIGANGAGKSNFVEFFRLMRALANRNLQQFVNVNGGADRFLHAGPKTTSAVGGAIGFGTDDLYSFTLVPTVDNELVFASEAARLDATDTIPMASGFRESHLVSKPLGLFDDDPADAYRGIYTAVSGWTVYHFHDTSATAPMRRPQSARDHGRLRPDGGNIAAFLHLLRTREPTVYTSVRDVVRLILPAFDDFNLLPEDPNDVGDERIRLEWRQIGSDYTLQPFQLSDGSIRYICLATALLQPNPPATIVFDEPELGLHPHALGVLAGLLRKASRRTQVIVATQSSVLVSEFEPEEIVVVSREGEASTFRRLAREGLAVLLDDDSLGDLWEKNYIDGASNG